MVEAVGLNLISFSVVDGARRVERLGIPGDKAEIRLVGIPSARKWHISEANHTHGKVLERSVFSLAHFRGYCSKVHWMFDNI